MKNIRRVVASVLIVVLFLGLVPVPAAHASVYTQAQVFDLAATGLAKVAAAESTIATAVSILGILGRVSTAISVGFVAYEVTTGFWDWWNKSYDPGTTNFSPNVGEGSWGVTSANKFRVLTVSPEGVGYPEAPNFIDKIKVGQHWEWNSLWRDLYVDWIYSPGGIATASSGVASVPGGNRAAALAELDGGIAALTVADREVTVNGLSVAPQDHIASMMAALQAARNLISNGLALDPSDYIGSPGAAGNPATAGTRPGAVPSSIEAPAVPGTVDLSGVTSAVSAASAAIAAAISASQAAVVSAVAAIPTAIAASATAVVAAVAAVAAPIVAAISASQAAVVSAVDSVVTAVSGITSHVDEVKTAVDSSAAADAARDQAATAAAAAAPSPAFVCPECSKVTSWSTLFTSLQATAAAAPIFGLISHLMWPGSGSVAHTWSMGTWQGHAMTVDLEASGLATAITVVRFVVIGGAVIVAYMIIFG